MFTEEIGYIFTWKIDKTVRYLDCKLRKIKKWSNDKMFHLVCSFVNHADHPVVHSPVTAEHHTLKWTTAKNTRKWFFLVWKIKLKPSNKQLTKTVGIRIPDMWKQNYIQ